MLTQRLPEQVDRIGMIATANLMISIMTLVFVLLVLGFNFYWN